MKHIFMAQEDQKNPYEEKKREREARRSALGKKAAARKTMIMFAKYLIGIAVAALAVYGIVWLAKQGAPDGEDRSVAYPIVGRDHIADGETYPSYNSNPPSSGSHFANPASEGFYDTELPDERVVHNLEHGDIWIAYHPRILEQYEDPLRELTKGKVITTARQTNDTDIALVAWGRVDAFNIEGGVLDTERIREFIVRYQNKGPENVAPSVHGG